MPRAAQRRLTIGDGDDAKALAFEMMRKQIANGTVVFSDDDRRSGHMLTSAPGASYKDTVPAACSRSTA